MGERTKSPNRECMGIRRFFLPADCCDDARSPLTLALTLEGLRARFVEGELAPLLGGL